MGRLAPPKVGARVSLCVPVPLAGLARLAQHLSTNALWARITVRSWAPRALSPVLGLSRAPAMLEPTLEQVSPALPSTTAPQGQTTVLWDRRPALPQDRGHFPARVPLGITERELCALTSTSVWE